MADWHAIRNDVAGNALQVVHHIPIPAAGNNRASVQWRTALVNSKLGGTTQLPDGDGTAGTISASEKSQIQSGALFEVFTEIDTNPGETASALQARVDAQHTALRTSVVQRIQRELTYYGYTRTLP